MVGLRVEPQRPEVALKLLVRRSCSPVFELLEVVEYLAPIKRLDVPRLRGRETSHGPAEMHEVRLDRVRERVHPDFLWKPVSFARVARAARR
jgi:hypothetical protein